MHRAESGANGPTGGGAGASHPWAEAQSKQWWGRLELDRTGTLGLARWGSSWAWARSAFVSGSMPKQRRSSGQRVRRGPRLLVRCRVKQRAERHPACSFARTERGRGVALVGKKQDGGDPRWSSRRDADPCAEEGTRRSTAAAACDTASTAAPAARRARGRDAVRESYRRRKREREGKAKARLIRCSGEKGGRRGGCSCADPKGGDEDERRPWQLGSL